MLTQKRDYKRLGATQCKSAQRGTGLIEAIAAMVVLSLGCAAIFSWVAQSVGSLTRLTEQERQLLMRMEAQDHLRDINPVDMPAGKIKRNGYTLAWQSQATHLAPTIANPSTLASPFLVSLHNVNAVLTLDDGGNNINITTTVAGFKKGASNSRGMFDTNPGK